MPIKNAFDHALIRAVDHLNPPKPYPATAEAPHPHDHFHGDRPQEIVPGAKPSAKPSETPTDQ